MKCGFVNVCVNVCSVSYTVFEASCHGFTRLYVCLWICVLSFFH